MIVTPLPGPSFPPNGGIVPPHLRDPKWNVPKPECPKPDQPVLLALIANPEEDVNRFLAENYGTTEPASTAAAVDTPNPSRSWSTGAVIPMRRSV